MNYNKSISEIIKQIKGSSSHFINQNNLTTDKFSWQTGYAAFSVSEYAVEKVYEYIKNQKQHHRIKSFDKEYDDFMKIHGLRNDL
jgi:REP element-mobilizing transposase RayT